MENIYIQVLIQEINLAGGSRPNKFLPTELGAWGIGTSRQRHLELFETQNMLNLDVFKGENL